MRLLLVEDDNTLTEDLRPMLKDRGYVVEVAQNGTDALFLATEEDFDVVILDLGLPAISGLDVLRQWRDRGINMPVLILTARDAWHERVEGLKTGADDYLGKPFHSSELLARLDAIVRRHRGGAANTLNWNNVTLDTDRQQVILDDCVVELTAVEFRLLRYLMSNPARIISKRELSEHIYQEDELRDSNVVEVYINRLRRHLGKDFIETRRGQGYRLKAEH